MKKEVPHDFVVQEVIAPASKSYAQRAILAACLSKGTSVIHYPGHSDDVVNIIAIGSQLGAEIVVKGAILEITGFQKAVRSELNCGESGLGIRLTTSIAAGIGGKYEITGAGSLKNRPVDQFEDFLPLLGVECNTNNGLVPIQLNGKIQGGKIQLDGSLSSQFLSGLLMALPLAEKDSTIEVKDLKSIPYIKMTLELLQKFEIQIEHDNFETFRIKGNQKYQATAYTVEGDWSGAAFWMVYGTIAHDLQIRNLNSASLQADREVLRAIEKAGGSFEWTDNLLKINKSEQLIPFEFDATHCPDLFPALTVLAAAIDGKSSIKGVKRLIHKESNRAFVLKNEFEKLGLQIEIEGDEMCIHGQGNLHGGEIHSNNDHRIAMAGAIAAALTETEITIENAESVNKSYPEFWEVVGV
ncbi:MAG: 3-phosphoshikimate 1-carboxyvinyltransferase [Crocinitomicaceae bacterium]